MKWTVFSKMSKNKYTFATRETTSLVSALSLTRTFSFMEEYRRLKDKGKEHLGQGNLEKAIEYYTRALKEAKKLLENSPGKYSPHFSSNEIRSNCSNSPEHDANNCEICSKFLELAVCYSNRALAYCNSKSYQAALLDAEEAIRLAPEWPKVNNRINCKLR